MARGRSEHTTRASASKLGTPTTGLVLLVWSATTRTLALPKTGSAVLGRGGDADLQIDDESLSRKHARFTVAGNRVTIEDLGSRNGTRIGGKAIEGTVELPIGAVAELGDVVVALHRGSELAPPPPATGTVVVDPTMKGLYELVEVIAPSDVSVLVLGETGTGKEVFSQAIHQRSRRGGELLALSCAALPETMLEAELFGYEKGAFTGAVAAKPGLFENADGGTIFLDEIGELPLTTQAKLLRFLETGETLRLGSVKAKRLDVRVVSATNRDLAVEVSNKAFRADLFFRLNGISVTLPPLRDRPTEIVPLAKLFLERASARSRKTASLGKDAIAALTAHPWPGNVSELKSVVERALLVVPANTAIEPTHLGLETRIEARGLRSEIEEIERRRILEALAACDGNQTEAARRLGLSRGTLLVRLDQFGIARPRKRS